MAVTFGAVVQHWLRSDRALRVFNGAMGARPAAWVILFIR